MEQPDKLEAESNNAAKPPEEFVEFKKPVYIGKIGKVPKKIVVNTSTSNVQENPPENKEHIEVKDIPQSVNKVGTVPYNEPRWSGFPPPDSGYKFEVLKSGVILETINLTKKPFFVFGRNVVDITMAHPTISRWHAVIQFKSEMKEGEEHPIGWYIYDLGSSHGTFLNKNRIRPNHYVRVRVGHLIKLGCSTRQFILQGPEEDAEEESELSLTEMKERYKKNQEMKMKLKLEEAKKSEDNGINWGMADDAEDEVDLSENPFAVTSNEELYLEDPKKTLRGFFEREGVPLQYDCEEKGIGQFLCRVELPIEDANGRPIMAEVIHKGKKKEAVVQCALEACRIIDRHGLLRQSKHESHKKKEKNWQEIDFYDSDEDTFLDRTGTIEKKREERIKKYKGEKSNENTSSNKALTYEELVNNCNSLEKSIEELVKKLEVLRNSGKKGQLDDEEGDELDKFMKDLNKQSIADKAEISKTKMEIQSLKQELSKMQRLAEIAKPADIPALIKTSTSSDSSKGSTINKTSSSVIIGKRLKLKNRIQTPYKHPSDAPQPALDECEEEVDSDEDDNVKRVKLDCSGVEELEVAVKEPSKDTDKRIYGPMRPPEGYVIPESYFDQENDRDLPEQIEENE